MTVILSPADFAAAVFGDDPDIVHLTEPDDEDTALCGEDIFGASWRLDGDGFVCPACVEADESGWG